jgi:hypothetical protein
MAITRYAGDRFTIGAGETKPTGVLDGAVLIDTGNLELYVKRDGVWVEITGAGTDALPGAPLNSVQFNNAGSFGGDADLTFTDGNRLNVNKLGISGIIYDSNNSIGNDGMVLTNEGTTGVNWKAIEDVLSGVGGSGVANYVARWADEDTLTSGVLYDNGTNVGVGTNSPSYKLDVGGTTSSTSNTLRLHQANGGTAIRVGPGGGGNDITLLRVDGSSSNNSGTTDSGNVGFSLKYMGSRDGNLNALSIFTDNVTAASQIEAVTILQDGNVGIGTTNPNSKLDVDGSVSADNYGFRSDSAAKWYYFDTFSGNNFIGRGANSYTSLYDTGTLSMVWKNGSVGIGTTNPGTLLDVRGIVSVRESSNIAFYGGNYIRLFVNANFSIREVGGATRLNLDTTNGDLSLYNSSTVLTNHIDTAGDSYFNGGNVGIGTASPSDKLHVVQNIDLNTALFQNTSGRAQVIIDSQSTAHNSYLSLSNGGSEFAFLDAKMSINLLRIATNNTGAEIAIETNTQDEAVRIDSAGNVGIGTTSPNDKLEIYGNMRVRGSDGFGANSTANYNPSYVAFPGGGKIGSSSTPVTGYIKITLPQSWTNTMMQFSIDVFEYQDNKAKTFVVAGYNYNPDSSWHNASAMVLAGNDGTTYKVQFGHDGSKCAIYISKGSNGASSSWTYPYVVVRDASFGFLNTGISNWIDGWNVSFPTSLGTITQTRDVSTQVTGSGTSQYIPKWDSTGTALSDSVIVQNNSNIGIGTTGPNSRLDVRSTSAFTNGVAYVEQGLATNLPTLLVNQTVSGGNQNVDQGLVVKAVGTSDGSGNTLHVYQRDGSTTGLVVKGSGNVGIGTISPDARLELSPSGNSSSGMTSKALIVSNTNDTSWTADALASYNATTGYDITDLSSLSFFARPTQGNILTFASETANNGTVHRFVNLNSSAVEPLYRWDFYQYDGSGTGSDNFKVPDKLFQIRVREGTSEVEKFTIKGNGNVGIGTNSPAQQLHLTGSIRLPNTTNTTTGIIYKDTSRFIHNYQHPTGDTAVPAGFNTFVGLVAGNLSMGSTATSVSHGSYNSGFGCQVLNSLTTGYSNTAIGFQAGEDITTGFKNTIVGMNAGGQLVGGSRNTFIGDDSGLLTNSGINNTALGAGALRLNTTGSSNTIVGTYSLDAHTSPAGHTTLGYAALTNLTTGSYNIAIGYAAGSQRVATGNLTNASYGIYLGYAVDGTEGASGEIVIGKDAQGLGSNTTRLGGSNITKTVIEYGNVGIGTTNPGAKLDINDTGQNQLLVRGWSFDGEGASAGAIQIGGTDAYSGRIWVDNTNTKLHIANTYNSNNGDIMFHTKTSGTTIDAMTIKGSGNVGIGTDDPTSLLHIDTAANSAANFKLGADRTAANAAIGQIIGAWDGTTVAKITLKTGDDTTNKDDGEIAFEVAAAGSTAEAMRIDSGGSVGIGITSPSKKLHVAGSTLISNNNYHYGFTSGGAQATLIGIKSNNYVTVGQLNANNVGTDIYGGTGNIYLYSGSVNRLTVSGDVNVQGATDLNINGPSRRLSFTSGTGTIRTTTSNNLILQTNSTSAITIYPTQQQIQFNAYGSGTFTGTATQRLAVDSSGNIIEVPIGSGAVDGSGAANKVTYWTDTDTISYNNNFHWDNTNGNLGIGTNAPNSTLHVYTSAEATARFQSTDNKAEIYVYDNDTTAILGAEGANIYLGSSSGSANGFLRIATTTGNAAFGAAAEGNTRLKIIPRTVEIASNSTNYQKAVYASALNFYDINSGITDSGYRIAVDASAFVSDTDFEGTLAKQYAVWARHGANVSGSGSTITNSYGVYIDSLTNADTTITNLWGLYQANSSAKNYFAGNVGIGTTNPSGSLHIQNGTSGATASLDADDLIVEGNDNSGISILTPSNKKGNLFFGDPSDNEAGGLSYIRYPFGDKLNITIGGNIVLIVSENGSIATSTGATLSSAGGWYAASGARIQGAWVVANSATDTSTFAGNVTIDGNVGIGTAVPSQKLHVQGNLRVTGAYYASDNNAGSSNQVLTSTGSGTDWKSLSDIGDTVTGSGTTNYVTKWSNGANSDLTDSIIYDDGTNVGIGTTNPECKLDIHDHTSATTFIADNNAGVRITNWGGDTGWSLLGFGGYSSIYTKNLSQIGSLSTNAGTYLAFGTSNNYGTGITNQAMTIDPSGNVGIGTTNPDSSLMVYKSAADSIIHVRGASNGADARVRINGYNSSELYIDRNGSGRFAFRRTTGTDDLSLLKLNNDYTDNSTIMFWGYSSGNVGIGNPADSGGNGALSSLVTLRIGGTGTIDSDAGQGLLQLRGYSANVNQNVGTIEFVDDRNGTDDIIGRINSSRDTSIGDGNLKFSTATSAGVLSEAMRIDSSGNVGIGTNDPKYKLDANAGLSSGGGIGYPVRVGHGSMATNGDGVGVLFSRGSAEQYFGYVRIQSTQSNPSFLNPRLEFGIQDTNTFNLADASTRMVITGDGKVGIGTTSPSYELEVSTSSNSRITASNTGYGVVNHLQADSTGGWVGTLSNHPLIIKTNNTEKVRVTTAGNVGIGTTAPGAGLHIYGSDQQTLFVGSSNANRALFVLDGAGNGDGAGGDYAYLAHNADGSFDIKNLQNNSTNFATGSSGTTRMTITSGGNVGIGTTSPDSGLTIAKNQTSAHTYTTSHLHLATPVTSNNGGATTISFATSTVDQYGWSLAAIRETTTGDDTRFAFKSHGGTDGGDERFSILADGNVGIGTTDPSKKLHVVHSSGTVGVFESSTVNTFIGLKESGGTFNYIGNKGGVFTIQTPGSSYSDKLVVLSDGNVGIGTTNPGAKLAVQDGQVTIYDGLSTPTYGDGSQERLRVGRNANQSISFQVSDLNNTITAYQDESGTETHRFILDRESSTSGIHNFHISRNGSYQVTVDRVGNVGIGTVSPGYPLHVVGKIYSSTEGQFGNAIAKNNSGIATFGSNSTATTIKINLDASASRNDLVIEGFTGNIGIGTASPSQKLDVQGAGRFTDGVIVPETTNGGFEYRTNSAWGGWARNAFTIANGTGGNFFSLGGYGGAGTTFTYGYIGRSYTDYCIRFYLDGGVDLTHNDVIKLSTTSAGVTVTGTLTADYLSGDGSSLSSLSGSNIGSGTVPAARLGSGSSITTKFLRGDNTWQTVSGGSTPNDSTITLSAGTNLNGGGSFTTNQSSNETITFNLDTAGPGAGSYGSTSDGTKIDTITLDAYGRVTAVATGGTGTGTMSSWNWGISGSTTAISNGETVRILAGTNVSVSRSGNDVTINASGNIGTITGVTAGAGLTGGGTSGTVTVGMGTAGPGAGSYGSTSNATKIDTITLDAYGRVTAVATGTTGDITAVTAGNGLTGGGGSGAVTLTVGASTGISVSSSAVSVSTGVCMSISAPSGTANPSSRAFTFAQSGGMSISASGSTVTFSSSSASDYRLKKNVTDFNSESWTKVKSVSCRKFDFDAEKFAQAMEDDYTIQRPASYGGRIGFIAHELEAAGIDGAVEGEKDGVDEDGVPIYQKVSYTTLVPVLWGALNEAIRKIEILESKVQNLENSS